jgi:nucleoside 2-deoxyribosyltransferase
MLNLRTTPEKAVDLIGKQIEALQEIPKKNYGIYNEFQFVHWIQTTIFILDNMYNDERAHSQYFNNMVDLKIGDQDAVNRSVKLAAATLGSFLQEIKIMSENPEFQEPYLPVIIPAIQDSLRKYKTDYPPPRKTAFIMMQISETAEHGRIFNAIRTALMKNEIYGFRADKLEYHEDLYYNVLTYLHGCDFGIAVFESLENRDFNPNVAFEVGYIKALGKHVCLLKEKSLERLHTDLIGKTYNEFDINNCETTIEIQLNDWLVSKGLTKTTI